MLTIFGKKKKDETSGENAGQNTPSASPGSSHPFQSQAPSSFPIQNPTPTPPSPTKAPTNQQPTSFQTKAPPPQATMRSMPPDTPMPEEETSLTRLLQSLIQDIPMPSGSGPASFLPESTPDWVPLRATPPSRPMMIGGGRKDEGGEWEEQGQKPATKLSPGQPIRPSKPSDIELQTGKTPSSQVVPQKPIEKATEKSSKVEKQPEKPTPPPKKETRSPQSFDHIFQLTQGNLENTGLVIINGVQGSGRTTLCSGLTGNYMKMGNPCLYLTYDQAPSDLRERMKKLGCDAAQYESQFRFIIVDGFASQSESFSLEPYYLDQPFSFDNIQDTLVRNSQIFLGDKIRVIFDSMDKLVSKIPSKDFIKYFGDLAGKMKESGATFIVTVDMSGLPKDLASSLGDMADCMLDLSKDNSDPDGRQLKVQRLNHNSSKIDAETFEIDSSKGLVFV